MPILVDEEEYIDVLNALPEENESAPVHAEVNQKKPMDKSGDKFVNETRMPHHLFLPKPDDFAENAEEYDPTICCNVHMKN